MKAALVVHEVLPQPAETLASMEHMVRAAADAGARLVLFAETALTGFVATGKPERDLALGEPVPGPSTARLATLARQYGVWLGFGLYERESIPAGDRLYDTAVLLAPDGGVRLRYRRITPQWHRPNDDPDTYRQGTDVPVAPTPFGVCAFLLCGDLFAAPLVERVRALRPDLLLVPFARRYDTEVADAEDWERRERHEYAAQVRKAGCPALLVNYLAASPEAGSCFGGALAVAATGEVVASLPPGRGGILLVEISSLSGRAAGNEDAQPVTADRWSADQ